MPLGFEGKVGEGMPFFDGRRFQFEEDLEVLLRVSEADNLII